MTFCIGRCYRKIHSIFGFEKCVRQRYCVDQFHFRIDHKFWINIEKNWHVNLQIYKQINIKESERKMCQLLRADSAVVPQSKSTGFY